uniref:Uncharacterized protein LOC113795462 isoform X2 n=1 Tax=Dermatophagoides pteronyssinus TaxID=6956 RepID=A0A6P6Y8Z2_DERPT|nr:uncharacterized protein LOC113795462 isoform X2 [Dermatophagoides pteronyssinus]
MTPLFQQLVIIAISISSLCLLTIIADKSLDWNDKIFGRSRQAMTSTTSTTTTTNIPRSTPITAFTAKPSVTLMPLRTYWSQPTATTSNSFNIYHHYDDHHPSSTVVHPYRQASRIPYHFPARTSSYHNYHHFVRSPPFFIQPQTELPKSLLPASDSYDWIRELIQTRLDESKRHLQQVQKSMEQLKTKTTLSSMLTTTTTTPPPPPTTIATTATFPPPTTTIASDHLQNNNRVDVDYADDNQDENLDYLDDQQQTNKSNSSSNHLKPGQRSEKIKGQKFAQTIVMNQNDDNSWKQSEIPNEMVINGTASDTEMENISSSITSEENDENRMDMDNNKRKHLMEDSQRINDLDMDMLEWKSINSLFGNDPINSTATINYNPKMNRPKQWSFQCPDNVSGFFADLSSDCQAYYHCSGHRRERFRFECPTGTRFNERSSNCDWQHNVDCYQQFDLLRA